MSYRRIWLMAAAMLAFAAQGCSREQMASTHKFDAELATPPANSAIVGTWRFASAGDEKILWPFLMKFDRQGKHTSGPTPFALTQTANYTFDGTQIVIGAGEDQLVIPNVAIDGNKMQFYGGPGAEDILLTYHKILP